MELLIEIDGIELEVKGEYFPEEGEVGLPNVFEIEKIELYKGDLLYLLEWSNSLDRGTVLRELENLVLQKIK
jgi:hypothetical protein